MDNLLCSLCNNLHLELTGDCEFSMLPGFQKKFFHDACAACDSEEDSAIQLCQTCKHLRLQHFVYCSEAWFDRYQDGDSGRFHDSLYDIQSPNAERREEFAIIQFMGIELGTFSEMVARSNCELCCGITKLILLRHEASGFRKYLWDHYIVTIGRNIGDNGFFFDIKSNLNPPGALWDRQLYMRFNTSPSSKTKSTARLFRSMSEEPIDWDKIYKWLEICDKGESQHGEGCRSRTHTNATPTGEFRVVDVDRSRVIRAPQDCEYITLSYVWGAEIPRELKLCLSNMESLANDNSISKANLPATIYDAMVVCSKLGKRYLWVDRLCIVQDDTGDLKYDQINQMDSIYSSAFLTIVAAGDDARSGISGISERPRPRAPFIIQLRNVILTEQIDSPFTSAPTTKWLERGWTYQEAALSSRMLTFSDFGVCYACAGRAQLRFEFSTHYIHAESIRPGNLDLRRMIMGYTDRKLTFDSDAFRAFAGILNKVGNDHQAGMPWGLFDTYIFWQPASWQQPSRNCDSGRTLKFPSWSWASIVGCVRFDDIVHEPVTSWAYYSSKENRFIPVISHSERWSTSPSVVKAVELPWRKLAWREGFFRPEPPTSLLADLSKDSLCRLFEEQWPTIETFWHSTRTETGEHGRTWSFLNEFSDKETQAAIVPGRLLLFTQLAKLRLTYLGDESTSSARSYSATILGRRFFVWDRDGKWMGMLELSEYLAQPIIELLDKDPESTFDFAAISMTSAGYSPHTIETVVQKFTFDPSKGKVGKARHPENYPWLSDLEYGGSAKVDWAGWEGFLKEMTYENYGEDTSDRSEFSRIPVLNVMLLGWKGDVAHRVGLGQVWLKRWVGSGPELRTVVLE